jgi:uncharacterized membrane protein YqjE
MDDREANPLRERSLAELLSTLGQDVGLLARRHVDLAKTEARERGKPIGAAVGMLAVALVAAVIVKALFVTMLVLLLDLVMPAWAAVIVVLAVYLLIALVLVWRARALLEANAPNLFKETTESIKEDVEWIKGQRPSGATSTAPEPSSPTSSTPSATR